jgi:hypothetical protein
MAVRRITQSFRSGVSPPINLSSEAYLAGDGWGYGGAIIDTLAALQENVLKGWSILGFSVAAKLRLVNGILVFPTVTQAYGKLGKIQAGLVIPLTAQTGTASAPYVSMASTGVAPSFAELPPDVSMVTDLWNPANDPLPPQVPSSGTLASHPYLPVSCSLILPTPLNMTGYADASTAGAIGMWASPSLLMGSLLANLYVSEAHYSLYYSDTNN